MTPHGAPSASDSPSDAILPTDPLIFGRFDLHRRRSDVWVLLGGTGPLILDDAAARALKFLHEGGSPAALPGGLGIDERDAVGLLRTLLFENIAWAKADSPTGSPAVDDAKEAQVPAGYQSASQGRLRAVLPVGLLGALLSAGGLAVGEGMPSGADLAPEGVNMVLAAVFASTVAVGTAALHEASHLWLGQTRDGEWPALKIAPQRALATTDLTRTWAWRREQQLAVLAAGLATDLAVLAAAVWWRALAGSWTSRAAVSAVLARILWQFGLHRRADGYLLVSAAVDDPFLREDAWIAVTQHQLMTSRTEIKLYGLLFVLGCGVDVLLIHHWLWRWAAKVLAARRTSR